MRQEQMKMAVCANQPCRKTYLVRRLHKLNYCSSACKQEMWRHRQRLRRLGLLE